MTISKSISTATQAQIPRPRNNFGTTPTPYRLARGGCRHGLSMKRAISSITFKTCTKPPGVRDGSLLATRAARPYASSKLSSPRNETSANPAKLGSSIDKDAMRAFFKGRAEWGAVRGPESPRTGSGLWGVGESRVSFVGVQLRRSALLRSSTPGEPSFWRALRCLERAEMSSSAASTASPRCRRSAARASSRLEPVAFNTVSSSALIFPFSSVANSTSIRRSSS
mmetsp:Transcript_34935/g.75581  ORF Transcript_34935/g.75581 Transcript_34935/m.75581 type:complete len:225 (-) Transcript_34935:1025-1699(-)